VPSNKGRVKSEPVMPCSSRAGCVFGILLEEPNILFTKDDLGLGKEGLAGRKASGVLI